jgi:outer membrane protein
MSKQLFWGVIGVLSAAVGILGYRSFFTPHQCATNMLPVTKANTDSGSVGGGIAYIDVDSLNTSISYIKVKKAQMETRQEKIIQDWQNGMHNLELRKAEFLKKGAGITQEEAEKFQGQLMKEAEVLENRKQEGAEKLSKEMLSFNDAIQKEIKDFIKEYNATKKFTYIFKVGKQMEFMIYKDSALNITGDVIKAMNQRLKGPN